jgi:hypothetical protein
VARDSERAVGQQGKRRARRKRTLEDREKRDAAFSQSKRGRPKGSVGKPFRDDPDRFAIAMIYCGECFLGMPRYVASYIALALTSGSPINAGSVDPAFRLLSGGPQHATLKGASYSLIAKCDRQMTVADAEWIASSAAFLGALIKLHTGQPGTADPTRLKMIFDGLGARGWAPILLKIAKKFSAVGMSNFPPIDEPVSSRVQAWLDSHSSKPKS